MTSIEETLYNLINMPNTYIGEAPAETPKCQWISLLGGRSLVHFDKKTYDYPRCVIYARDIKNELARNTILEIYHKVQNYTESNVSILISRTPTFTGRDLLDRSVYSFQIEYQTGGY